MFWLILQAFLVPNVLATKTVFWKPNTNWADAENWQLGHIPCAKEKLQFPEDSLIYISSSASFSELEIPANSLFLFGKSSSFQASQRKSGAQCKSVVNKFIATFRKWYEPSNWCSLGWGGNSISTKCDASSILSSRVAPLLHIPCGNDRVVFAENTTQQMEVDLHGDSLYEAAVAVGSLVIDGQTISDSDTFRQFLRDEVGARSFQVTINGKSTTYGVDEALLFTSNEEVGCERNLQQASLLCPLLQGASTDNSQGGCAMCGASFTPVGACCAVCEPGLFAYWFFLQRDSWSSSQSLSAFLLSLDVALKQDLNSNPNAYVYAIQPVNGSFVQLLVQTTDGLFAESVRSAIDGISGFAFRSVLQSADASRQLAAVSSVQVNHAVATGVCLAVLISFLVICVFLARRASNREAVARCFELNCAIPFRALRLQLHQTALRRRASAEIRADNFITGRLGTEGEATEAKEVNFADGTGEQRYVLLTVRNLARRVSSSLQRVVELARSTLTYAQFNNESDGTARPNRSEDTDVPQLFDNPTYETGPFDPIGSTPAVFTFDVDSPQLSLQPASQQHFVNDLDMHSDLQQAIHAFAGHTLPSPAGSAAIAAAASAEANLTYKRSLSSSSGASPSGILHLPSVSEFVELEMSTTPRANESNA